MRILFCNYEYPPLGGGGGVINALLAEELAKRHEVTVLTSQGLGLPLESIEKGVKVLRAPVYFRDQQAAASIPSMLAFLPMGIRLGRSHLQNSRVNYDVINTHFALPTGPVGDALARFAHIPNVLSVHGGDLYDPSKWYSPHRHMLLRLWIQKLMGRADCVVGQSKNTLKNVHDYYDPGLQVERIPLGIKRPASGVSERGQYGFNDNDVLLVTVGRLVARKATDQLITMLERIKSSNTHLLIIGDGPQEQYLREIASEHKLDKNVHFLGHVGEDEKFRILRMSDVFVSTSQHEGFGLVFVEAMACGLPVICYDYGGQTDFLENNHTGYLIPLNDQQALQQGCTGLIQDQLARKRMGNENMQRVEELFIDHCAERYEKLFAGVIEKHRNGKEVGNVYAP